MSTTTKANLLQSYQVLLYNRALHPEFFPLKGRRVLRHGNYELEAWIMEGAHLLRFEHKALCACELLTPQDRNLPATGVVTAFLCAGERDYEHRFAREGAAYVTSVQTETLSEHLYNATYEEVLADAQRVKALAHRWSDETGKCLSVVEMERHSKEVRVQSFHLIASIGLVLRTQTIFEHA